ncbi:MAG: extracellular solute-binding protein [Actinocatenispora sp.]
MNRTPPGSGPSRRTLIGAALGGAGALLTGGLAGCAAEPAAVPRYHGGDVWRRFAGTTINFVSENTAPTAAIAANTAPFTELTGITVRIVSLDLASEVQRVALDLAGGQSQYHVIYADPYQVLAPYHKGLVDLREFIDKPGYPELTGGLDDFVDVQLDATGRFGHDGAVYALPYDCPTMVWQYRRDIFDKHHDRMADALGFDPTPGADRTWEQYLAIASWINQHADEVPYGTGHQAKQHDSLMCDFSNVLWAYGGDYFAHGAEVGRLGAVDPGGCRLDSPAAHTAAELYGRLLAAAHPGSRTWDWDGVGAALRSGQIAMTPNWHEYAAANEQAMPGKFGYAPLPRGPRRNAHMFGGTGIGISANAGGAERGAAWLFVNWATAPDTQLANLKSKVGGGTPTRGSVYRRPEVRRAQHRPSTMPNILTEPAVRTAWRSDDIGLRPKIPMWNECDTAIFTELSTMIVGDQGPSDAMRNARTRIDRAVSRGWSA